MTATLVRCAGVWFCLMLVSPAAVPQSAAAKERPHADPAATQPAARDGAAVPGADEVPAARAGAQDRAVPAGAQAVSLQGEVLASPPMTAEARAKAQAALAKAQQDYANRPDSVDALVWLGRRFAGQGKYKEAVALFTQGLKSHPDDPHLLRHRGHRYITLRQFDDAVADLSRAAELVRGTDDEPEPPLTPNAKGIILDTFHENVFYHLALAHYLRHEDEAALAAWRECGRCVKNDDGRAMVAHWTYLTLHRMGRAEEAQQAIADITPEMDIVEYHAYHNAVLVYRGLADAEVLLAPLTPGGDTSVDFASLGYGIANWLQFEGDTDRGLALLRQVAGAEMWPAFGRIAAEADLLRRAQAAAQQTPAEPVAPAPPGAR